MDVNRTQQQSGEEQSRAQALSLTPSRPPTQVPGYEPRRFLGRGAYGEVWVAVDRKTGRQVAIKFYAHRGGLDWSILSREVEKLAFLSADRYVVQLLDVGWDADPPYYVMEYIEQGSLEELLARDGKLPARDAVALFREVAVGLLHAHGKGVLHCDLKPANVLLDQDSRPRLADFGQSRLSHEQTPALGTLFYMAPEQADLQAVPDVRWDVYALGALLYCMLTGSPPHRDDAAARQLEAPESLEERLLDYRKLIADAPPPQAHRHVPEVDRELADIIDGCLAADRRERYANVQEVIDALNVRDKRRARRPLVLLGFLGPAILLGVMLLFAWSSFAAVMDESDDALRRRALKSNSFAARYAAASVTNALEQYYGAVEEIAASYRFQSMLSEALADPRFAELRRQLSDPRLAEDARETLRGQLVASPARQALQERLEALLQDPDGPDVECWFVTDPVGLQLARAPEESTVGENFGWRSYFNGRANDQPPDWRPRQGDHIRRTNLSAVYYSHATNRWTVTISAPVFLEEQSTGDEHPGPFLGIVAMAVNVHKFLGIPDAQPQLFAALVDWRSGPNQGLILAHPLFDKLLEDRDELPERFRSYRVREEELPDSSAKGVRENYVDPVGRDPLGQEYDKHWLAQSAPVAIRDGYTGWIVIVQESYDGAIGATLSRLRDRLFSSSLLAAVAIVLLTTGLWALVVRSLGERTRGAAKPAVAEAKA